MTAQKPRMRLRVAHLSPKRDNPFSLDPTPDERAALAAELGLRALPAMRFEGTLRAQGGADWALDARLTARVVQDCVVTLEPVETAIDERVELVFSPHVSQPEGEEVEMADDSLEPLGSDIDIAALAGEALALAVPLYPRAAGAALPDGIAPEGEAEQADVRRPFADLGRLLADKS